MMPVNANSARMLYGCLRRSVLLHMIAISATSERIQATMNTCAQGGCTSSRFDGAGPMHTCTECSCCSRQQQE